MSSIVIRDQSLRKALQDIKEAESMLKRAKAVAPETERVLTDGHGNWYGVRNGSAELPIPTTHVFGPDDNFTVERFED